MTYPDYDLKPFHTYATGNLEWLAAAEVRPASTVIACRTFKEMDDAFAAEARLRRQINATIRVSCARRRDGVTPASACGSCFKLHAAAELRSARLSPP